MPIEQGQPVRGMRPARIMAPIFSNNSPKEIEFSRLALRAGVMGLMLENCAWLYEYPQTPLLYQSGCFYKPEKRETQGSKVVQYGEDWQTIPYVMHAGFGDCEDLGAWRSAELRMLPFMLKFKATGIKDKSLITKGIKATPFIKVRQMPGGSWRAHVVVKWPNGTIEDPSAKLGMYAYQ
jgi:hypothetical protein